MNPTDSPTLSGSRLLRIVRFVEILPESFVTQYSGAEHHMGGKHNMVGRCLDDTVRKGESDSRSRLAVKPRHGSAITRPARIDRKRALTIAPSKDPHAESPAPNF
jgi:hypothetical protein